MKEEKMTKGNGFSALSDEALDGVTGGLRSMDWRTCKTCGYLGGGWLFVDGNRNVRCPECGAKQSAW